MTRRLVITGAIRSGKDHLAHTILNSHQVDEDRLLHTDSLISTRESFSEQTDAVVEWMLQPGPWIIVGITAIRALRRLKKEYPDRRPCEEVIFLPKPLGEVTPKQRSFDKGANIMFNEIRGWLGKQCLSVQVGWNGFTTMERFLVPGDRVRCAVCKKTPWALQEYKQAVEDNGGTLHPTTVEQYVVDEEGTYNHKKKLFTCTPCYISIGQPAGPIGWHPAGWIHTVQWETRDALAHSGKL